MSRNRCPIWSCVSLISSVFIIFLVPNITAFGASSMRAGLFFGRSSIQISNRIRERGKREVLYQQRRNEDWPLLGLTAGGPLARAHGHDIVQHRNGALIEPEILDWPGDPAVLDQKRSVTGEPGLHQGARVHLAHIPDASHQHA